MLIDITCSFADRWSAARFTARATRRAGASRLRSLTFATRMLLRGRAVLPLRPQDAALYLGLSLRGQAMLGVA